MSMKITTDLMREWYVRADHSGNKSRAQYEREFDSWLAEHDRQVAERAWDAGFDAGERDVMEHKTFDEPCIENPYRAAKGEQKPLDPRPWLFISDQVFGEFRSDHDKGYHGVSGTYWTFSPRPTYSQNREDYAL